MARILAAHAWRRLAELVRADHAEGARSHDGPLAPEVTRGIVAGHRAKAPRAQFFLAFAGEGHRASARHCAGSWICKTRPGAASIATRCESWL